MKQVANKTQRCRARTTAGRRGPHAVTAEIRYVATDYSGEYDHRRRSDPNLWGFTSTGSAEVSVHSFKAKQQNTADCTQVLCAKEAATATLRRDKLTLYTYHSVPCRR
jgi:hypothetical protein